jgi:hypothetical protein
MGARRRVQGRPRPKVWRIEPLNDEKNQQRPTEEGKGLMRRRMLGMKGRHFCRRRNERIEPWMISDAGHGRRRC